MKHELYPTLFERIDIALPEHNFKYYSRGWRSNTYLDGSPHKRKDKTVINKKAPGYILEQGGEILTIVNYVMRRDNVEFIHAVKTLAKVAGLKIPRDPNFDIEGYQMQKERAALLEDCNSYFVYCLENSSRADEVRNYLTSRGYSEEDIKIMELGYIPSQDQLFKYLFDIKKYSKSLIYEVVKLNPSIGNTHILSIPYRSGGSLKGFKFRAIGDVTPKYLNSTGLKRGGGFFNLSGIKGDKDLVIVEGELDSLSASARGIENVVATGGSSISTAQIKDAIRKGAKSFTICFDYEPGKEEESAKRINSAIEIILEESVTDIYIVRLPNLEGKTDPDKLIKENGVEAFQEAIRAALPYYEYRLKEILKRYYRIKNEKGLEKRDIDRLLNEVLEAASQIPNPVDRDRYKKLFISLELVQNLGITEDSLSVAVDRLTSTKEKEAKEKEFKKLISKATQLQNKGEVDVALDILNRKIKEVKLKDKAKEFSRLMQPIKEAELKERQANKPESLTSGYEIDGIPLLLPAGAISVFTAPTSHGKTTFLINLALNLAQEYTGKETYFFSFKEDVDSILIKTLSTYLEYEISLNINRSLKSYFATGSTEYIRRDFEAYFNARKETFFNDLIESGRLNINYSTYDAEMLVKGIRYLHEKANPGAIFIDYFQLLSLPRGKFKTYSRTEELKEICIALKNVAVETGLPVILGAQFNERVINHLHLHSSNIAEAGDIERMASLIVGFWNNNFNPIGGIEELREIEDKEINNPKTLYTKVLKNREGIAGRWDTLSFDGNRGKVSNRKSNMF